MVGWKRHCGIKFCKSWEVYVFLLLWNQLTKFLCGLLPMFMVHTILMTDNLWQELKDFRNQFIVHG